MFTVAAGYCEFAPLFEGLSTDNKMGDDAVVACTGDDKVRLKMGLRWGKPYLLNCFLLSYIERHRDQLLEHQQPLQGRSLQGRHRWNILTFSDDQGGITR